MDPVAKQILNSLKCPLCGGRVDLIDWKMPYKIRKYNFCCVNNWEHYRLYFVHWDMPYFIEYENVTVNEGKHQYDITQFDNKTEIYIFDIDPENRIIEGKEKKAPLFQYDKKLFNFSQTTREKVVNRVKTILLFQ